MERLPKNLNEMALNFNSIIGVKIYADMVEDCGLTKIANILRIGAIPKNKLVESNVHDSYQSADRRGYGENEGVGDGDGSGDADGFGDGYWCNSDGDGEGDGFGFGDGSVNGDGIRWDG